MTRVARTMAALAALRSALERKLPEAIAQGLDPLETGHSLLLERILADQASALWRSILQVFGGQQSRSALQQSWSVAHDHPIWIGLLFRAAQESGVSEVMSEALRLRALTGEAIRLDQIGVRSIPSAIDGLGRWLLTDAPRPSIPIPDLGSCIGVKGSLRLRFHLACHRQMGQAPLALFKRAAIQAGPTMQSRRAEFARLIQAIGRDGGAVACLRPADIVQFSDRELRLFLELRSHWPRLLTPRLARAHDPAARVGNLVAERARLRPLLGEIAGAISGRNFKEVDALVARAGEGPIVDAAGRLLRERDLGEETDWSHPALRPQWGPWQAMSPASLERLERWRGRSLPRWWALSATQIHDALLGADLVDLHPGHPIPYQDLLTLQRSFKHEEALSLLRIGFHHLVGRQSSAWQALSLTDLASLVASDPAPYLYLLRDRLAELPDARPWLALVAGDNAVALKRATRLALDRNPPAPPAPSSWQAFCATSVGTLEWHTLGEIAYDDTVPLKQAVEMYRAQRAPVDIQAFRVVVAKSLSQTSTLPPRPIALTQAWLAHDPDAIDDLIIHAATDLLTKVACHRSTAMHTLEALIQKAHGPAQQAALRARTRKMSMATLKGASRIPAPKEAAD